MKEPIKLVVVIPVGPNARVDYVRDTVESVHFFTGPSRKIVIVDDSHNGKGDQVADMDDVVIVPTPHNMGRYWGLYASLCFGMRHAVETCHFDVCLRMDADALVTGPHPEDAGAEYFQRNPNIGLTSDYWYDCNGERRDNAYPIAELRSELKWTRLFKTPTRWRAYRRLVKQAKQYGYQIGENCFGGSYFISGDCVRRLYDIDALPYRPIKGAFLEEDHIFSLIIRSIGMELGDFCTGDLPMAQALRGMPISPQDVLDRGKLVVHSTRFWADIEEDAIRTFFKEHRDRSEPVS